VSDLRPGRGADVFQIRLPDGMRDRIKGAAAANGRSMNAEIISRLEESFDPKQLGEMQVIIDSTGSPISWESIHTTLGEITRRLGAKPVVLNVRVITPELVSSRK